MENRPVKQNPRACVYFSQMIRHHRDVEAAAVVIPLHQNVSQ